MQKGLKNDKVVTICNLAGAPTNPITDVARGHGSCANHLRLHRHTAVRRTNQ